MTSVSRAIPEFSIETFTGQAFSYVEPLRWWRPEILDIAVPLGRLKRYLGHSAKELSVAEHSVLICCYVRAQGRPPQDQLTGLLHDSCEAFLGDLPRDLKAMLPQYKDLEEHIEAHVLPALGAEYPLPVWLKPIDSAAIRDERSAAFAPSANIWITDSMKPLGLRFEFWSSGRAAEEFITEYRRLKAELSR